MVGVQYQHFLTVFFVCLLLFCWLSFVCNLGHWIPETGSCMAVEKRPATSTAALAASTASSSLDFSKDSLNSTASGLVAPVTGGGEILHRSSDEQGIGATATATDDVCDDEEDGSESCSIKLEPLAFTIDFGDVSPVKSNKKKETPKRLAERLAASSGQSSSQKRQQQANKAEAAKKVMTNHFSIRHWIMSGRPDRRPFLALSVLSDWLTFYLLTFVSTDSALECLFLILLVTRSWSLGPESVNAFQWKQQHTDNNSVQWEGGTGKKWRFRYYLKLKGTNGCRWYHLKRSGQPGTPSSFLSSIFPSFLFFSVSFPSSLSRVSLSRDVLEFFSKQWNNETGGG